MSENKYNEYEVAKEKLKFVSNENRQFEQKLETKPRGYFQDAFYRFKKNKASIIAAIIIGILLLFAIVAPIFSKYTVAYEDITYKFVMPKSKLFTSLGIDFWDGCREREVSETQFYFDYAIGVENGHSVIKNDKYQTKEKSYPGGRTTTMYKYRLDTYYAPGTQFLTVTPEVYGLIQQYQDEKGIQVIYPMTDPKKRPSAVQDNGNGNIWFETEEVTGKTNIKFDANHNYVNIYLEYKGEDNYTSKMRIENGESKLYEYASPIYSSEKSTINNYYVRVDYYEYYIFYHSYLLQDGITEPYFVFGTTDAGKDIWICLASGARFSFLLAIAVSLINLLVGAIYGAIEGYYGGRIDLIMERIVDILGAIPMMIVITLLKYHMEGSSQVLVLFLAFFATGWIGMAGRTRMQFYRFKNQEYVMAARTLGAKDVRIMFKHIFPNAIGTLITSCVLIIPSVIFSETSLSYLQIINLETGSLTSVGTLLAKGQQYLVSSPHMILFPSIFISLLMLSFNLFGNGLRDAFNPSLRGTEE